MSWIPIEDGMPEEGVRCLVCWQPYPDWRYFVPIEQEDWRWGAIGAGKWISIAHHKSSEPNIGWYEDMWSEFNFGRIRNVTHWQPLPEVTE